MQGARLGAAKARAARLSARRRLAFVTEFEIRSTPEASGTRVDLEHRNLDRYGDKAEAVRASLDSHDGWDLGMEAYAEAVARAG